MAGSWRVRALLLALALVSAVGALPAATSRVAAATPVTAYSYSSAPGDYIGQGQSNSYTPANATFGVFGTVGLPTVWLTTPTENWHINLAAPLGTQLHPGSYSGALTPSIRSGAAPGLDVNGDGRACNHAYGSFTVNEIGADRYGNIVSLDATFSQHCESRTAPALTGHVQYQVGVPTPPLPPNYPASFSFVGGSGDYMSQGASESYGSPSATFLMSGTETGVAITVLDGNHRWDMQLQPPSGQLLSAHTVYMNANEYGAGGQPLLTISGDGRGCANDYGTFVVRQIGTDASGGVDMLDASFSQSCERPSAIPLNGDIRFNATDPGLQLPSVSVHASPAAVAQGQAVTVSAAVTSSSGAAPTGAVELLDDGAVLGTLPLDSNGAASLTTPLNDGGLNDITARYLGDWQYAPLTGGSATVTVSVPPVATTTVLTTTTGAVRRGNPIDLRAAVSAANGYLPTGSVVFFDGATRIGSATLDQYGAAYLSRTLAVGSHTITATYGGDAADSGSMSNAITVSVSKRG